MNIGEKLRFLRKSKKLTTTDIAVKVNVTQSYISQFENGRAVPDIFLLKNICNVLGVTLAEFFTENEIELHPEYRQLIKKAKKLNSDRLRILNEVIDEWVKD